MCHCDIFNIQKILNLIPKHTFEYSTSQMTHSTRKLPPELLCSLSHPLREHKHFAIEFFILETTDVFFKIQAQGETYNHTFSSIAAFGHASDIIERTCVGASE